MSYLRHCTLTIAAIAAIISLHRFSHSRGPGPRLLHRALGLLLHGTDALAPVGHGHGAAAQGRVQEREEAGLHPVLGVTGDDWSHGRYGKTHGKPWKTSLKMLG